MEFQGWHRTPGTIVTTHSSVIPGHIPPFSKLNTSSSGQREPIYWRVHLIGAPSDLGKDRGHASGSQLATIFRQAGILARRSRGMIQHDARDGKSLAEHGGHDQRLQRLIDSAQHIARNDQQREPEFLGQIGHVLVFSQRRHQSAGALDQEDFRSLGASIRDRGEAG